MDFNNYYKLNTNCNKPLIKKEISNSICDIIKEKRNIGYSYNDIIKYFRILFNKFFDPDNENTRSLYKNKICTAKELCKNVINATKRIVNGDYIIPAFANENKQLTDTFKQSVYTVLNRKLKSKKSNKKK